MYSPWHSAYYCPPGPLQSYSLLRAQRIIQSISTQNVILNRQVCNLAKQNVDLKQKLLQMNVGMDSSVNREQQFRNTYDVGYAKEVRQKKLEEDNNSKHLRRQKIVRQVNTQLNRKREQNKRGLERDHSFGRINRENTGQMEKKKYNSAEKYRNINVETSEQQKRSKTPSRFQSEKRVQKKFNYLSNFQKQQSMKGQQSKTIIQKLAQSKMNPQFSYRSSLPKPIIHIQSQPYPIQSHRVNILEFQNGQNEQKYANKKDNKVYLQQIPELNKNQSPISKLKSIKKNQYQSQVHSEANLEPSKSLGRKHYLSLIGNIMDNIKNQDKGSQ